MLTVFRSMDLSGSFFTPLLKGGLGGSHKSLLDLLVRTDTKGVGRGRRGCVGRPLPRVIVCAGCGKPWLTCPC